jgi:hypothetical protein
MGILVLSARSEGTIAVTPSNHLIVKYENPLVVLPTPQGVVNLKYPILTVWGSLSNYDPP